MAELKYTEFASVFSPRESFPDLPAIAERLGVPKNDNSASPGIILRMTNGDSYSLFALMNAFLDRIDSATK